MSYKQDVLEMLVFELREQFKGSCAIVLTTENGLYSEFYANKNVIEFIKSRVQEYYPEFHYVDKLRNATYPAYSYEVLKSLRERSKDFVGFSCNKELINYLKIHVPYKDGFLIFNAIKPRLTSTPHVEPFKYDVNTQMLTILDRTNAKIYMHPKDVVDFMSSISRLKGTEWKPSQGDIKNTVDALRSKLIEENYKKLDGPIDCEVWGVFNDDIENLLMLEIIYPYTGSRHINVALDLSKF